jgi:hypothetical protein
MYVVIHAEHASSTKEHQGISSLKRKTCSIHFGIQGEIRSQFLIPVENDLAHFDVETITESSKRGAGAEVAEEIAEF